MTDLTSRHATTSAIACDTLAASHAEIAVIRHLLRYGTASVTDVLAVAMAASATGAGGPGPDARMIPAACATGLLEAAGEPDRVRLGARGRGLARKLRGGRSTGVETAEAVPPVAPAPLLDPAESPLAWLHRRLDRDGRPMIDAAQFEAGERLRADLWLAGLTPRTTQSWSGLPGMRGTPRSTPGGCASMSDTLVAARQRVSRALAAVGPELGHILVDVCGHLRGLEDVEIEHGWPKRSAKLVLVKALTALARHYGLIPSPDVDALLTRRIRHWGSDDFRPTLERWKGNSD